MSVDTVHDLLQRVAALERKVEHLYAELRVASPDPFEAHVESLAREA